jgi:hypothetical protein
MDQGQTRTERMSFETERHRITGLLTLARDGYRSRVSDLLNASERDFISLTEVTVEHLDGAPTVMHDFVVVSRRHIVLVVDAA